MNLATKLVVIRNNNVNDVENIENIASSGDVTALEFFVAMGILGGIFGVFMFLIWCGVRYVEKKEEKKYKW